VSRLLSHYWTAADDEATRQAQVEDWIDDLVEFDLSIIVEACTRWRRQPGGRRPTPGDIRKFCIEEQTERHTHLRLTAPFDREAYARQAGWSSWLEREDAIRAQKERERQGMEWQRAHAAELAEATRRPMAKATARATAKVFDPSAEEIPSPEEDRRARRRQREGMLHDPEEFE
jgi:hypothetical protein